MNIFRGKKSYALAVIAIVYAITGFISGHIDGQTAIDMVWTALAVVGLRSGVTHEVNKIQ